MQHMHHRYACDHSCCGCLHCVSFAGFPGASNAWLGAWRVVHSLLARLASCQTPGTVSPHDRPRQRTSLSPGSRCMFLPCLVQSRSSELGWRSLYQLLFRPVAKLVARLPARLRCLSLSWHSREHFSTLWRQLKRLLQHPS
jgi:hypothetical protein